MKTVFFLFISLILFSCTYSEDKENIQEVKTKHDSVDIPRLTFNSSKDSLKIVIRTKRYNAVDIYFGYDSIRAVSGKPPKYLLRNIRQTTMIKVDTQMFELPNVIYGAYRCWDSTRNFYHFFPFSIPTKNYR